MDFKKAVIFLIVFALTVAVSAVAFANPVSTEDRLNNISFSGIILEELTPEFIAKVKDTKAKELKYLDDLEKTYQLPTNLLKIKWLIESRAGELNIKNKKGYEGHFQFGKYEQKLCNLKDPYNFEQAARSTVCLLRDYHIKFQSYTLTPVDWSTRNVTDFYMMHQQGFRGAGEQYNAIVHEKALTPTVKFNMCGNIPTQYKKLLFKPRTCKVNPGITDKQYATFFYKLWETEMARINLELLK